MDLNIYVQQQTVSGEWGDFAQEVSSRMLDDSKSAIYV